LNLLENPDARIQVWSNLIPVTARTATPEEKARPWSKMTALWPDYDAYQQKTERDIPLVILSERRHQ
jgi:deazaflavin-dependent oxidoreductase (nitroreductase family)